MSPSTAATKQRLRFRLAQQNYMNLSKPERSNWEELTRVLALPLTGQNLYISLALKPEGHGLATAIARTGISVTTPTEIPI